MTPKVEQVPVPTLAAAPASPPVFGQPAGQKPGRKTPTPSFLNAASSPSSGQLANKTLVGQ